MSNNCSSTREEGCWSFNVAEGYATALNRWLGHIEDVAHFLKRNQVVLAQKSMSLAEASMRESNIWFNQANNQQWRIEALVTEVKASRNGQSVSYCDGGDPVSDDWKVRS